MPLQTEDRPRSFKQFLGNTEVIDALRGALKQEGHNHCMLFSGPAGCGKTTLARIVARMLGAYNPGSTQNFGFREINASDMRGIDTVRMIREEALRVPIGAPVRVFFCDECHMITRQAQEAFLKLLEEASGYNYFIFATTDPQLLSATFKRRVAHYALTGISNVEIQDLLEKTCDKHNLNVPDAVIEKIVQISNGSAGVALGLLDTIKASDPDSMIQALERGQTSEAQAIELCRMLVRGDTWKSIATHLKKMKEQGEDPEGLRRMVLGYCSSVLLSKDKPSVWLIMESFMEPVYNSGFPGIVFAAYQAKASMK